MMLSFSVLIILWLLLVLVSLLQGPESISSRDMLSFILHPGVKGFKQAVFWQLRLPRLVSLSMVGVGLGVSGVLMQGLFRNSLADPGFLGVASGSAFAVVLALVLGAPIWVLNLSAFVGAGIVLLILSVASVVLLGANSLLLLGVAIGVLCSAASSLMLYLGSDAGLQMAIHWSFGGVELVSWSLLGLALIVLLLALFLAYSNARALDVWGLDRDSAFALGLNFNRLKFIVILSVTLCSGMAVVLVGPIAFIGLIVPHIGRAMAGPLHKNLLGLSSLLGAILLLISDLFCRALHPPLILPLGLATALIGAPLFIGLLVYDSSKKSQP